MLYAYAKQINSERLQTEIVQAGLLDIQHIDTEENNVYIYFPGELTTEEKWQLDSIVTLHVLKTPTEIVTEKIQKSVDFGLEIIKEFATENVLLGITQLGMTGTVRKSSSEIMSALSCGSLYDAIIEIDALPPEKKDARFLTDERLLVFKNKILAFLATL